MILLNFLVFLIFLGEFSGFPEFSDFLGFSEFSVVFACLSLSFNSFLTYINLIFTSKNIYIYNTIDIFYLRTITTKTLYELWSRAITSIAIISSWHAAWRKKQIYNQIFSDKKNSWNKHFLKRILPEQDNSWKGWFLNRKAPWKG